MKYTKLFAIALCATLCFTSCDNDDDDLFNVPSLVESLFMKQFPNASNVSWEKEQLESKSYLKAEFKQNGVEKEAWYTEDGTWVKTETDFNGTLPAAVTQYLTAHYAGYKTDDVDFVETLTQNFYKIEVEKGKHEVELSITEEGAVLFIKDNQATIPAEVLKSFEQLYPNTTVKEWEKIGYFLKAEFYVGQLETEVWFTYDGKWIRSSSDYEGTLPQAVTDYIAQHYADYTIDDIHWVEIPDNQYFEIDIEKGEEEFELSIQKDGTFIGILPID